MSSSVIKTSSALSGNASYASPAENVSKYSSVQISVYSDKSSAINGLVLSWSDNNADFDHSVSYSVLAETAFHKILAHRGRYFKVAYTNSADAQTVMRLSAKHIEALPGADFSAESVEVSQSTSSSLKAQVEPISGASFTVTATALDMRALTNTDVVTVEQATAASLKAQVEPISGASFTVTATALDMRALTSADTVTAVSGTAGNFKAEVSQAAGRWEVNQSAQSCARSISLAATGVALVNAAARLSSLHVSNLATAPLFLKLYDIAAPDEDDTPMMTLHIAPESDRSIHFPLPLNFATAIGARCTTAMADNDTGAPSAGDLILAAIYS